MSVKQENIEAGGDVVAGDKKVNNYFGCCGRSQTLDELYSEISCECDSDLCEFIDQLRNYANRVDRDIIGLEEKLVMAKLGDIVEYAMECKEKFEKILYRHQHSMAAQKIYFYFLSKARSIFQVEIRPELGGLSPREKKVLVRSVLVQEIHGELGKNPLGLGFEEVYGMVFFLTGNCHLRWD